MLSEFTRSLSTAELTVLWLVGGVALTLGSVIALECRSRIVSTALGFGSGLCFGVIVLATLRP